MGEQKVRSDSIFDIFLFRNSFSFFYKKGESTIRVGVRVGARVGAEFCALKIKNLFIKYL